MSSDSSSPLRNSLAPTTYIFHWHRSTLARGSGLDEPRRAAGKRGEPSQRLGNNSMEVCPALLHKRRERGRFEAPESQSEGNFTRRFSRRETTAPRGETRQVGDGISIYLFIYLFNIYLFIYLLKKKNQRYKQTQPASTSVFVHNFNRWSVSISTWRLPLDNSDKHVKLRQHSHILSRVAVLGTVSLRNIVISFVNFFFFFFAIS